MNPKLEVYLTGGGRWYKTASSQSSTHDHGTDSGGSFLSRFSVSRLNFMHVCSIKFLRKGVKRAGRKSDCTQAMRWWEKSSVWNSIKFTFKLQSPTSLKLANIWLRVLRPLMAHYIKISLSRLISHTLTIWAENSFTCMPSIILHMLGHICWESCNRKLNSKHESQIEPRIRSISF